MAEAEVSKSSKRGYLEKDFELFHLKDNRDMQFDLHYHDFNKIIIFISGSVTYFIEGRAYRLKPWDVLLVSSDEVHRSVIDTGEIYERSIIWVNSGFLTRHSSSDGNLLLCFDLAAKQGSNLLRLNPEGLRELRGILAQLEAACRSSEFGSQVLSNSLFLQFIVSLNRLYLKEQSHGRSGDIEYDESIGAVLDYIKENLCGELAVEELAERFYMNRYHLMHKFKKQTGYTIHNYIMQKRLILANSMIKAGKTATDVCIECGFGDYSSFVRAFKNMFGLSPKKHYKRLLRLEEKQQD